MPTRRRFARCARMLHSVRRPTRRLRTRGFHRRNESQRRRWRVVRTAFIAENPRRNPRCDFATQREDACTFPFSNAEFVSRGRRVESPKPPVLLDQRPQRCGGLARPMGSDRLRSPTFMDSPRWLPQTYDYAKKVTEDATHAAVAAFAGNGNIGEQNAADHFSRVPAHLHVDPEEQDLRVKQIANEMASARVALRRSVSTLLNSR
jgi:hypothetical protein